MLQVVYWHYSDAYRTVANIAMDYLWFLYQIGLGIPTLKQREFTQR